MIRTVFADDIPGMALAAYSSISAEAAPFLLRRDNLVVHVKLLAIQAVAWRHELSDDAIAGVCKQHAFGFSFV
jgi:hypothetical protein